ncbi:unnamed protein product, partial [Thlaspi arvense]
SFDLYIYAGGYWSPDDAYLGREAHPSGKHLAEGFSLPKKEDIDDAEIMEKVLHYGVGSGAITLFAVREDDPYIGRRAGLTSCWLSDEEEDGLTEEEGGLAENDDRDDEAEIRENADYLGDVYESANDTDTDCDSDDNQMHKIDDCKYKKI